MADTPTNRATGPERARGLASRLSVVVEGEARRMFNQAQLPSDPARVAQGWECRFITDAARGREAAKLYLQLGYEVCLDPIDTQAVSDGCSDCWLLSTLRLVTIYTRRRVTNQDGCGGPRASKDG